MEVLVVISHDDCDEIMCENRKCEYNEAGYCYIAYNLLDECEYAAEFISERIKIQEDYIRDIPDMIDEEYVESETIKAQNDLRFWKSLLSMYN